MKSPFTAHLSLVGQMFLRARMDKHVVRPMCEKQPKYGPPIIERPIRSMGRFFSKMDGDQQKEAILLARQAKFLPRIKLDQEYMRFERSLVYKNFTRVI